MKVEHRASESHRSIGTDNASNEVIPISAAAVVGRVSGAGGHETYEKSEEEASNIYGLRGESLGVQDRRGSYSFPKYKPRVAGRTAYSIDGQMDSNSEARDDSYRLFESRKQLHSSYRMAA